MRRELIVYRVPFHFYTPLLMVFSVSLISRCREKVREQREEMRALNIWRCNLIYFWLGAESKVVS